MDYEQADKSDEEYVNYIISQFHELDAYQAESVIKHGGTYFINSIVDNQQEAFYTEFLAIDGEIEYTSYTFPDRMLLDQVAYYRSNSDTQSMLDPEFTDKIDTLEETLDAAMLNNRLKKQK